MYNLCTQQRECCCFDHAVRWAVRILGGFVYETLIVNKRASILVSKAHHASLGCPKCQIFWNPHQPEVFLNQFTSINMKMPKKSKKVMSKGCHGPSLVLLHSTSIQIWRKSKNSISKPFLPSEVLGKWLNQLSILKNIMLGTKIIKIGPLGPDLSLGASK